jgi:hypothetical protein
MEKMVVHVLGLPPGLLCNSPSLMLAASDAPTTRKRSIPTPEVEAEGGAYRLDGKLVFPTAAFRKCAISGAKGRKVGRTGLNTILMGAVFADPDHEYVLLFDPVTREPLTDYRIDIRRAVPPGQGAVRRARPLIDDWAGDVHLLFDDEITDEKAVADVMGMGGRTIGTGNLRPEKGGSHGRFVVTGWTSTDGIFHPVVVD